ncbi:deoxyguanosinetriphosphate triphosphohydrolase [Alkaliphilus serpentinus]|uniref:Deoxyguanosinetriphosphate triphosphohydrolase n=1 Tax=Alkaliphilus serpentinus TaxID=1482731 RepID=A0A833HRJ5_9FIRM|nr:deoxyguanosinetriphosphate triphosphohydrolase [Alkaliphilus serpentinus]KAB3533267.1 deoxyguanosinetriphosphate triphosphohydrolase [Alkaliphilus serpentinus]
MENLRNQTEKMEGEYLSEYAQLSVNSKGRKLQEEECEIRTAYQRDRDRIIHSKSFRALKEKTQVFIVKDDFFRTRLSHTLEVSQIARTIARALRLNEDLVEAVALGHDLGHTCFGHSGEEVLHNITGDFKHNHQSLRVIDILEGDDRGLNLTYEVRDGILNHTGKVSPVTLEGKLVKLIDTITYLCHDIQDSISAGILKETDIPHSFIRILGDTHSKRINTFVKDIIYETSEALQNGKPIEIYQSQQLKEATLNLREFMFKNVYNGEICLREKEKATFIVRTLFDYFSSNPNEMPLEYIKRLSVDDLKRVVTDCIAGATDAYAIRLFQSKFVPSPK